MICGLGLHIADTVAEIHLCFPGKRQENEEPPLPGLLIIAHGAPMPEWNSPVLELGEQVAAEARKASRLRSPNAKDDMRATTRSSLTCVRLLMISSAIPSQK